MKKFQNALCTLVTEPVQFDADGSTLLAIICKILSKIVFEKWEVMSNDESVDKLPRTECDILLDEYVTVI